MVQTEGIIQVSNLQKTYNQFHVVKGISFSVQKGDLFAFLGTNGAGKSTTIDILCTLLKKTSGTVYIDGYKLDESNEEIRNKIGVVFQDSLLDDCLTVFENIITRGYYYRLSKKQLHENYQFVSEYLKLDDIKNRKYKSLSGGQRRRADIARALIHKPKILFLDEPTTGLDPKTRILVWDAIKRLKQETNMTIFLTTHYLEEAVVADQVVVLKDGSIISEGTPEQLKDHFAYDRLTISFKSTFNADVWLKENKYSYMLDKSAYHFHLNSTIEAYEILKQLDGNIESFEVVKGSMEDVFINIIEERGVS
ncbi:ABC transporter ATP-binding protein [Bacillus solimangrovi]|uniref:ABC transporter n=1 Tax=Bacillus solimangrovi TaxID=1305675 RepID=A0A1E5LID3_9BACI|nr:ABC transporter ATP-binding protein [Bacillus solimangrovi]OEH93843.1 ABC transporter [Bacillus solimangrovi]